MADILELVAVQNGSVIGRVELKAEANSCYYIGRAQENDFCINSAYLSRKHAALRYYNDRWYFQNLSQNGSFVNGKLAEKPTLIHGNDRVSLSSGAYEVQLILKAGTTSQSTPQTHSISKHAPSLARDLELLIVNEHNSVRFFHIESSKDAELSFGRGESCQLSVESAFLKSLSGQLIMSQGRLSMRVADKSSVRINGSSLHSAEQTLSPGDTVSFGNSKQLIIAVSESGGKWVANKLSPDKPTVIGRSSESDIQLTHISVSRRHASIRYNPQLNGYTIESFGMNGTLLNGMTVSRVSPMPEHSVISIANTSLYLCGDVLYRYVQDSGLSIRAVSLSRDVTDHGVTKRILDDVNLSIHPGEFVAIIGGSGCGKSTLLNALTGYERASAGAVLVNGSSLYNNNDYFKSLIGFVPQQDIVFDHLRLDKMLEYTARLRMAKDTDSAEREARVREVLELVELSDFSGSMIKKLSGGQKKRASIAVELLADPGLFFLDEPTSGLDPGTERNLMHTLRRLATNKRKTVIMVTHTTLNLHLCDKIIVMGKGGQLCYCGSPDKALKYFKVSDFVEIYDLVSDYDRAVRYANSGPAVTDRPDPTESTQTPAKTERPGFFTQLAVLQKRYLNLIYNDTSRLLLMLIEPVALVFLLYICKSDDIYSSYIDTKNILFTYVCCGIWIGLFNAVQEICKERVILKREYMANLRLSAYVFSKFNVQALLCFAQSILLFFSFTLFIGLPDEGILLETPIPEMLFTTFLTILSSCSLALCLSAVCKDIDKAMTLSPFLLVFQLIFAGIIFPLEGIVDKLSMLTVSRWSISAMGVSSDLESLPVLILGENTELFDRTVENLCTSWGILLGFALLFCFISMLLLRNISKDSR